MQEQDPLTHAYDIEALSAEAIRAQDRRQVVNALATAFTNAETETLAMNPGLAEAVRSTIMMGVDWPTQPRLSISEAYDEFSRPQLPGIVLQSRIIKAAPNAAMRRQPRFYEDDISDRDECEVYLLAFLGHDRNDSTPGLSVGANNIRFGAIRQTDGHAELFAIRRAGDLLESEKPHQLAILSSLGISQDALDNKLVAIELEVLAEQTILSELRLAASRLEAQTHEAQATQQPQTEQAASQQGCIDERLSIPLLSPYRYVTKKLEDHALGSLPFLFPKPEAEEQPGASIVHEPLILPPKGHPLTEPLSVPFVARFAYDRELGPIEISAPQGLLEAIELLKQARLPRITSPMEHRLAVFAMVEAVRLAAER